MQDHHAQIRVLLRKAAQLCEEADEEYQARERDLAHSTLWYAGKVLERAQYLLREEMEGGRLDDRVLCQ